MQKYVLAAAIAASAASPILKPVGVVAAPLTPTAPKTQSLRVVIDAGHGGVDTGLLPKGVAAQSGTEKDVALLMALQLKSELEQNNIEVVMTRTTDKFVSLHDRVNKAQEAKADYFVSLHLRDTPVRNVPRRDVDTQNSSLPVMASSPYEINYKTPQSKELATSLEKGFSRDLPASKFVVQPQNFYVLREPSLPSVMVSGDLKEMTQEQSRTKLVHALATTLVSLPQTRTVQ